MASTIAPYVAFDYARQFIKNMPLERVQVRILDDASKMLWGSANWRWSISNLSAITLLSNTQDYVIVDPGDFNFLIHSYISDGVNPVRHLEPVSSLPSGVLINGNPDFIAHTTNLIRVSPNPGTLPASPIRQILSWYKKNPPSIIPSTVGTSGTLIFDDMWFWVYQMAVLYYAYLYGDDQRAGSATFDQSGKFQYSGQRAMFEAAVEQMKQREPLMTFQQRSSLPEQRS